MSKVILRNDGWYGPPHRAGGESAEPLTGCRCYSSSHEGVGSVLEVVLDDLGGQGWTNLHAFGPDRAHDFSAANDFGRGESGNFRRQHQANLELYGRLQQFLRPEQQAGAADVFRGAGPPICFAERAIAERQLQLEAARAIRRRFLLFRDT